MELADQARGVFMELQNILREDLFSQDSNIEIIEDEWIRKEGGGGRTWAFSNGKLIEKGGINFSDVSGDQLPKAATLNRPELAGSPFRAMGVSVVFHPLNPHIPTAHANVRYFEASPPNKEKVWWFGGGIDLTPYYPVLEDVVFWHQKAKDTCDLFGQELYPNFKKWCDEYFFLPHRNETRGVGGIFFDDYSKDGFDNSLSFVDAVGTTFGEAFFEIANRRSNENYDQEQKDFQRYRRGRYVEFNLIYDRGTHFGLQSKGRTESILMSMPPRADWTYEWTPQEGSKEKVLYDQFLRPRDWLNLDNSSA
tara:strand:- start:6110 stop:7033 length:924 start_codon:yes stop_codon:yes gene_type:complete